MKEQIHDAVISFKSQLITYIGTGSGIIGAVAVWQEQLEWTLKILVSIAAFSASITAIIVGRKSLKNRKKNDQ